MTAPLAFLLAACIGTNSPECPTDGAAAQSLRADLEPRANFIVPAVEIVAMDSLLNAIGRQITDDDSFNVTRGSIRRNLRRRWVVDDDPFEINQVLHPYQGAMYQNFARSTGLNYWQSLAYTFAGSLLWEIAGETTPPSKNDQIASGVAGTFLGEPLFRIANLLIDRAQGRPGFGRSLLVAIVSPPTAFNRMAFGDRFDTVMSTHDPAYDMRFQIGASRVAHHDPGRPSGTDSNEAILDTFIDYGLPGKADYRFSRPFDYFSLHATASSANGLELLTTRGLLAGKGYDAGRNLKGVWGLYGLYDYLSPEIFRVSTAALSVGTTAQAGTADSLVLQGTLLGGVGYAAVQAVRTSNDRNYHYGISPQAMAAVRMIVSDRVSLDLIAREYFLNDTELTAGDDAIFRGEVSLGVRVYRRNAVTVRYVLSQRQASLLNQGTQTHARATLGLFYTLLGPQRFGAVHWRH